MGPNQFNPPLDSYQESWSQKENFDSNSLLTNQNGEWISQFYNPCNLEPSYSYPPPSEKPIDKLEQMMRGMEDSLFELQKLRGQVNDVKYALPSMILLLKLVIHILLM